MVYYEGESANVSYLIENLMTGYDKRLRPNYKGKTKALCAWGAGCRNNLGQ